MKKIVKQVLTIVLTMCIILSEWGGDGVTVNAAGSNLSISGESVIKTIKKGRSWTCKGTINSNHRLKEGSVK
mgnify:FL=1